MAMLYGCAPAVVGGAVAAGGGAAAQDRGISGVWSDAQIQARINKLWFDHDLDLMNRLDMTVESGRVLLTGRARDPQMRVDGVRLAWQAEGVTEVINEIEIDDTSSLLNAARDEWITIQLRSRITFDRGIYSLNYTIDTVNSVVYLMGSARSREELERVVSHARSLADVARVVSYVKV